MKLKLTGLYYGWWIVIVCFLLNFVLGAYVVLGFTAFFEPIADEFGWSYAQVALASSLRGMEATLLAPLLGFLVDRWGPKRMMFAGVAFLGMGYILLSHTTTLSVFYIAFAIIALGSSGLSPTVTFTSLANWFRKRVGITSGIVATGFAAGSLLIPCMVRLIDMFTWQTTVLILGFAVWIVGLPLSLLLRHRPEEYGYFVDGSQNDNVLPSKTGSSSPADERDFSMREVLRNRTFWHISLSTTFQTLVLSTITVHVMPYLTTVGFPRSVSSLVAMIVPLISIIGRLSSGWLVDRYNKIKVAVAFIAMLVTGILFLNYISYDHMWLIYPYVIAYGIGWGGGATIRTGLVREYFGRNRFGSVFGLIMGMSAMGGIIGPFFAGWMYDNLYEYHLTWQLFAGVIFIALIIMATTPQKALYVRSSTTD